MCSSCQMLLSIPAEKGGIKRVPYGKKNASFVTDPASATSTSACFDIVMEPTVAFAKTQPTTGNPIEVEDDINSSDESGMSEEDLELDTSDDESTDSLLDSLNLLLMPVRESDGEN
eukprot:CAMPEP_0194406288 /NCGR_PEP_ID=MMETSP0176-20130528/4554_1 /TAXON_ID=216777 /ORGANISM="Proboscia alata, Strain PI-D3" /LENGTH=115 /DNA_ID=CAMNT_0039205469 /DNA_START=1251 /DNA_END=1595 /DNA_ORIENTATION=-